MRCGVQGDKRGSALEARHCVLVGQRGLLRGCRAPDWGSKMPNSTSREVMDHLLYRYTRYERPSPVHLSPGHVAQRIRQCINFLCIVKRYRVLMVVRRNRERRRARVYSPPPPSLVAIWDTNTQGLNVWNRRGLYCVRGGVQGPIPAWSLCLCLTTKTKKKVAGIPSGRKRRRNKSPRQG